MKRRLRLTLAQWFVLTTLALALLVGATFTVLLESARRSILARSDELRDAEALRIDAELSKQLAVGADAIDEVARALRLGLVSMNDPVSIEARLFAELLDHPTLSDVTMTHATRRCDVDERQDCYDADGHARLAPDGRWQVTVYRQSADPDSEILTRRTTPEAGHFVDDVRRRPRGGGLASAPFVREQQSADPTSHLTFETTASKRSSGRAIWSDLSRSQLDERRVVLTVQQAIEDAPGHFAGVLRAGLLTQTIDDLPGRARRTPTIRLVSSCATRRGAS